MSIKSIMTRNPLCTRPTDSMSDAARLMGEQNVGMLPVCDQDHLVGTVTDRDLVVRGVARGVDPNQTPVNDVMTHELVYCSEDQSIDEVCRVMEKHQIRRVPIVNDERRLVGIVALADVAVRAGSELRAGEVLEQVSEP